MSNGSPQPSHQLLGTGVTQTDISRDIGDIPVSPRMEPRWLIGFGISFLLLMLFLTMIGWLFARGVGIWGIQIPVAWGFAIINFVWWIGIGHAGTFISAILFLLHSEWRRSINRFAEAMTLFAVACAATFPLLHLGRPQYFYYLVPYPNDLALWPQFRSPLVWDFFAVSTYGSVSILFWYIGLVPDLATMRDRAKTRFRQRIYGFFALGWLGTPRQWRHYRALYAILAGLATPLVISVHSIVGLDFAVSIVPGWHKTVFPPYFVAGAIFSGFAMVATIVIPVRAWFRLHHLITDRHLDNIGKVMLVTGFLLAFGYLSELFFGWYSGSHFERMAAEHHLTSTVYYALIFCNVLVIQLLWWPAFRRHALGLFAVSIVVNVGMWLERFIIVTLSLSEDYLTSSFRSFHSTFWDWSSLVGSIGLFCCLVFLFIRVLPIISMHELKETLVEKEHAKPHE